MARIASQSKAGYYPTPIGQMELVLNRIEVEEGSKVNLLDPCAGTGEAQRQMADYLKTNYNANPVTYGVELEETRAKQAVTRLDHVLHGGYQVMRMTKGSVSCIYLNPPYDADSNGQRYEKTFFADLTMPDRYLQEKGLVIFCIPQYILPDVANLAAGRLEDIRVYRFTDDCYPVFKQVVLLGYRRKGRGGPETLEVKKWLEEIGQGGPGAIPTLDTPDGIKYKIPPADKEVALFRGSIYDPKEIAYDVDTSKIWDRVDNMLLPSTVRNKVTLKPFTKPLSMMHTADVIVSRAVNGNMGGSHLLVGLTKKVVDKKVEEIEGNEDTKPGQKITELERHVTICRIFSPQGVFTLE